MDEVFERYKKILTTLQKNCESNPELLNLIEQTRHKLQRYYYKTHILDCNKDALFGFYPYLMKLLEQKDIQKRMHELSIKTNKPLDLFQFYFGKSVEDMIAEQRKKNFKLYIQIAAMQQILNDSTKQSLIPNMLQNNLELFRTFEKNLFIVFDHHIK